MSRDAEKRAEEMINKLRKLKGFGPMTPEEADIAYEMSPADPISDEEIESMIAFVTSAGKAAWEPTQDGDREQAEQSDDSSADDFRLQSRGTDDWVKKFPLKDMRRLRFSLPTGDTDSEVLLKFFKAPSPRTWQARWQAASLAFRQTSIHRICHEAVAAWVREAEIVASDLALAAFDERRVRSSLADLRHLTRLPADRIFDPLQAICARAGVAVVLVPELPQTCISGCARWLSDTQGLIGLTLRYKSDDQFWFTFFHEMGHILLHRHKLPFVLDNAADDLEDKDVDPDMEQYEAEANRFAADTLIPPAALSSFVRKRAFTNDTIHEFADAMDIGPGIVVGRLQHEGFLKPFQGNKLKQTLNWNFGPEE